MKASRIVIAGAAALAAWGVLGMVPPGVQASSASAATWTQQHPAASPPGRESAAMAYDAATGTVVLFGGWGASRFLADTWTWNGTTWTQQHPAVHPPARTGATMAYDAATGTEVLFGGHGSKAGHATYPRATWTWNGTTWTQQHPAVHPPARWQAAMAYDAATGTAVLFGGLNASRFLADTWTWNGTTWTQQHPAVHPAFRTGPAMAYDAATGTAVLFGGQGISNLATGTWTWNGTTWTQQHPAASPPGRLGPAMAYDAATGTVVLFGGQNSPRSYLTSTWTWG